MKRMVRQLKRSESIARTLVDRITSSNLKDGDSLESEIVMMEELNTGRGSSAQWHTGTRTGKSDVLRKLAPRSLVVEIHPSDAARLRIVDAAPVVVSSPRGEARATAVVTATVQPGVVFMPMHFEAVNRLTFPAYDPHSRQPSYKACSVALRPAC